MWRLHRKPFKFLMKSMSMHEPPIVVGAVVIASLRPNMRMKSRKAAFSFVDTSRLKSPMSMNGSLGEIRRSVMGSSGEGASGAHDTCSRCFGLETAPFLL
jgi:hypothetical protein